MLEILCMACEMDDHDNHIDGPQVPEEPIELEDGSMFDGWVCNCEKCNA